MKTPKKTVSTEKEEQEDETDQEYQYELKIPKARVAVLIGKKGETKKDIEENTNSRINIDSKEGDVEIKGYDTIGLYNARTIIIAIGRGFNPEIARLLLKQDYSFEIIDLKEYIGRNKNTMIRFKGRVIGSEGKSRKTIENLTDCYISVYGKTIGIIGELGNVAIAKKAIENLLKGALHSNVYKFLEKRRRDLKLTPELKERFKE